MIQMGEELDIPTSQPGTTGATSACAPDLSQLLTNIIPANSLPPSLAILSSKLGWRIKKFFGIKQYTYGKESVVIDSEILDLLKNSLGICDLMKLFGETFMPISFTVMQGDFLFSYFVDLVDPEKNLYNVIQIDDTGKEKPYDNVKFSIVYSKESEEKEGYRGYIPLPAGRGLLKTGMIQ